MSARAIRRLLQLERNLVDLSGKLERQRVREVRYHESEFEQPADSGLAHFARHPADSRYVQRALAVITVRGTLRWTNLCALGDLLPIRIPIYGIKAVIVVKFGLGLTMQLRHENYPRSDSACARAVAIVAEPDGKPLVCPGVDALRGRSKPSI